MSRRRSHVTPEAEVLIGALATTTVHRTLHAKAAPHIWVRIRINCSHRDNAAQRLCGLLPLRSLRMAPSVGSYAMYTACAAKGMSGRSGNHAAARTAARPTRFLQCPHLHSDLEWAVKLSQGKGCLLNFCSGQHDAHELPTTARRIPPSIRHRFCPHGRQNWTM